MPLHFLVAAFLLSHSAEPLTDRVRQTLITGPGNETLLEGKDVYYGLPSTYSLQFDPKGKYVMRMHGPLGDAYGFDGKTGWKQDLSGAPRWMGFEDGDAQMAITMLLTDGWIETASSSTVSADPTDPNALDVKSPSGLEETISIDPSTNLPQSAKFTTADGEIRVKLSEWRPVSGRILPFHTEITTGSVTDSFDVQVAKPAKGVYSKPSWRPEDTTFDETKSSVVESQGTSVGLLIVHPRVNGKDVGWFILDSGAEVMTIDPKVANQLELPKIGKSPVTGIGGTIESSFRQGATITLGPLTVRDLTLTELDLGVIGTLFKVKIAGIVGYDVFRRAMVAIDFKAPTVQLFDPAKYKLPKGSAWSTLLFDGGNPVIQATCEGDRTAWYRLDTGDGGTVTFHAPYVKQEHLLDNRTTAAAASGGVGGFVSAKSGKIDYFLVGGHRFEKPDAVFSLATKGAFSNRYLAGNIGQTFMKPFEIVFDFGGGHVAFLPRSGSQGK